MGDVRLESLTHETEAGQNHVSGNYLLHPFVVSALEGGLV
jgi:hypothetical protein